MSRLLLNCDIGESFGNWTMGLDAEVMPFIDCANVACGFHAGDPSIMRKTVSLALSHGVQIGVQFQRKIMTGLFGGESGVGSLQGLGELGPTIIELRETLSALRSFSRRLEEDPAGYLLRSDSIKEFQP